MSHPPAHPAERLELVARLAFANLLLVLALASTWAFAGPGAQEEDGGGRPRGDLVAFALVDTWTFVALALFPVVLVCGGLAFGLRSATVSGALQAVVWTLVVGLFAIDARVHALFGYHLTTALLSLPVGALTEEDLGIGLRTIGLLASGSALLLLLEGWLAIRLARSIAAGHAQDPAGARRRCARRGLLASAALAALPITDLLWFRCADLERDVEAARILALPPWPLHDLAPELGLADLGEQLEAARARPLVRSLRAPSLPPDGPRPNVLLVVVESLRHDMLDDEVMPHASALARRGRRFTDHLSGGNATRFGMLSLLYGLHATYAWSLEAAALPPPLVEASSRAGYEGRVLSHTALNYPQLRDMLWATFPERAEDDDAAGERWERDERLAGRFDAWMQERRASGTPRPFFGFVALDAAHYGYSWPRAATRFTPVAERFDLALPGAETGPDDVPGIFNRYRNAVHFVDAMFGRIVESLRAAGELERTIVVLTGDHGEEFLEHGAWCHTSNFSREQVGVPLVLFGPGIAPGVEARPTAHVDVGVTLLELLGARPADRPLYSVGCNLLDPPLQRGRVLVGFEWAGIWLDETVLRVPFATRPGQAELFEPGWRRRWDTHAWVATHTAPVEQWLRETSAFVD